MSFSREMIMQNFYARLSHNDRTMLDSSFADSFSKRSIEFKWDLIERIKCNFEDWEVDKGNELGIKLEYDCVKSFVETLVFIRLGAKYGLDFEIVATFCESFAAHVGLPKEKWFKFHPPIKDICEEPIIANTEILSSILLILLCLLLTLRNHIFLLGLKNMLRLQLWFIRVILKHLNPLQQIKVEPSIAMVKDLLVDNIDGHVI